MALPNTITVQVDADTARAVAQVIAASKVMERSLGSISADIDFDEAGTNKKADSAGTNANKSWWKGFGKEDEKGSKKATSRLGRLLTKWTGIIAAFGETIGVALYGAGGSILSLGASLLSAASASAAFIPIAVGLGAAIGAIAIGAAGVGKGLTAVNEEFAAAVKEGRAFNIEAEGIKDALAGMAPAAADLVVAFSEVRGQLAGIQSEIQQQLFKDLGDVLRDLATTQLPSLGVAFGEVAGAINESFKGFIDGLEGYDLGGILSGLVPIISNVLNALTPLTTAFLDFLVIATPYAETLSEQFLNWAQSIADFTSSAGGVEAIKGFLDRAVASLQSWLGLIGATGKVISTFMGIASSEGDSLVDSLTRSLNTFNDWMKADPGPVLDFLETSSRILKALGPLLKGVQGFFTNLVTPDSVTRFEDLSSALGEILPLIGELLHALGEADLLNVFADAILAIGNALKDSGAIDAIASLAAVIGDTLGGIIQSIVDSGVLVSIGQALAAIGAIAEAILPALGQLIEEVFSDPDLIQAFNEGLVAVTDAMNALLPAVLILIPPLNDMVLAILPPLLQLLPPLAELIGALAPVVTLWANALSIAIGVQTTYFGFLANVAVKVIETLIGWLTDLVEIITGAVTAAFEGLSSAWQATTEDVAAFYERNIAPVVEKVAGFGLFTGIKNTVVNVWNGMWQAMKDLYQEFFGGTIAEIGGYARGLVSTFQSAWDGIKAGFSAFINFFKGLWTDAKSAWDDTLVDLRQFGNDAVAFFAGLPARFASALSGIVSAIGDQFRKAWEKAKEYVDKIKNLPGSIAGGVGNFIGGLNPFAKGGIVFGPTPALIGEAGAEAVIPLQKPLSQIDPSVRAMAALLRNGPTTNAGNANNTAARITRAQTNNFTINDMTGNAEATAQKIVNRLVSL